MENDGNMHLADPGAIFGAHRHVSVHTVVIECTISIYQMYLLNVVLMQSDMPATIARHVMAAHPYKNRLLQKI